MGKIPVESLLQDLSESLGVRKAVSRRELGVLYDQGDYMGIIATIQRSLRLDMKLVIARVRSGGPPNAPAWVCIPKQMPPYGTREFRALKITVYIRHYDMSLATFEQFVVIVAHELTHIVLDAIGHELRDNERAVDLTAMLLGYAEFYAGATVERHEPPYPVSPLDNFWKRLVTIWKNRSSTATRVLMKRRYGYLSQHEIGAAIAWIRHRR